MTVTVIGISFHTAPIELRELAAVRASEVPATLRRIQNAFPGSELVLVSTCNRTELYAAGIDVPAGKHRLIHMLLTGDASLHPSDIEKHFYVKSGLEAAEHLLAVASSLDAMVVGETEILGQVKQALGIAEAAQTTGKVLHPLFQNAFRIAKRVHSETDVCRGRVSVSSLAVEFAEKVFDELSSKTVMIVGAGETAELALKSLMDRGAREVLVLNRSMERGQALAEHCGGRAIQFDLLEDYLPHADIVISSTSAPHLVIQAAAVQRASAIRRGRPMLMVDIAVPRDIDPAAGHIENVYVYSIDDLQRIAAANLAKRQEAVDQAWQIVRQGTAEIATLFESSGLRQLLRKFDEHGREICEQALQRALARERLAALPEPSREEIRTLAQKIVNKMLAEPREALKRAAKNSEWDTYARVVNDLFGFDRKGSPSETTAPEATKPPDEAKT
ncbi:MAG: glutamyl-tRNA reductase [bacterium]